MTPSNNPLAIASLACGVASFIILPCIGSLAAVITGHMALGQIRRSAGQETGEGLAKAGLVLGYINIVLSILGAIVGVIIFAVAVAGAAAAAQSSGGVY